MSDRRIRMAGFTAAYWDHIFKELESNLKGKELPAVSRVAEVSRDPFKVLVSTVISLRTKDEVTSGASERLFARAENPGELAAVKEEEIERLIYPAGFYRTKAKNLKQIARILLSEYGGRVPSEMDKLLSLPGVGRKTANLVRNEGYGLPGICVDTHVHRISNRIGWVSTKNPTETEYALEKVLPEKYWIPINTLLVGFGKRVCTPISPWCSVCPLYGDCSRAGVGKRR
jgi:endonuclease-3